MVENHCIFAALTYLKEKYPPERVALVEKYISSERSSSHKARKRYVKVPSGKRQRVVHTLPAPPARDYIAMGIDPMAMM